MNSPKDNAIVEFRLQPEIMDIVNPDESEFSDTDINEEKEDCAMHIESYLFPSDSMYH